MNRNLRKWLGLFCAVILYYVVHEGAHLIFALFFGVFKEVRILGLGVQIAITSREAMTNLQFAIFNVAGAVMSLTVAYLLVFLIKPICSQKSSVVKAIAYYATVLLLLNDPVYLGVLCGFFGGGDMNGIVYFGISEWVARLIFGIIGVANLILIYKVVYPKYRQSFMKEA